MVFRRLLRLCTFRVRLGQRACLHELNKGLFLTLTLSDLLHTSPKLKTKRGTLLAHVDEPYSIAIIVEGDDDKIRMHFWKDMPDQCFHNFEVLKSIARRSHFTDP